MKRAQRLIVPDAELFNVLRDYKRSLRSVRYEVQELRWEAETALDFVNKLVAAEERLARLRKPPQYEYAAARKAGAR